MQMQQSCSKTIDIHFNCNEALAFPQECDKRKNVIGTSSHLTAIIHLRFSKKFVNVREDL